jgi:membrane fusion protein (multidrug efflux system)
MITAVNNPENISAGKKRRRRLLIIAGPLALLIVGGLFYLFGGRYATTDNAYVKSYKVSISPEVEGRVDSVRVGDNARVHKGDILFTIERQPYEIALAQAEGNLGTVRSDILSMRADYRQRQAETADAEENVRYQQRELNRFSALARTNTVAQAKLDQVRHDYNDAVSNRESLKQELAAQAAKIGGDVNAPLEQDPHYRQAQAALDKAKLDLARTQVSAPIDGIVANMNLRAGEFVAPGLPLFSVVNDHTIWIEANFKETDLTDVRAGQPVDIEIDTYGGRSWRGKVASITPATGAEFSILPAENSSGNWVKVVQRLMVRIEFTDYDGNPPLAAGMSSYVRIDTGHNRLSRMFGARP